jgi:ribonucleotide reductase beta subunit family protein with ferritin-like domain
MSAMSLVFVWLDQRIGNLPGGNEKLKDKFRKVLSPLRQFDKPTICLDFLRDSIKDKRVLFLTSGVFAEEDFLRQVASLSNVIYIYVYDQQNKDHNTNDQTLLDKMGVERVIHFDERLYEQLINDLIQLYTNEGDQCERARQKKEAKQLFEYAAQLIDTIEDQDQDLQQIQRDLFARIDRIK